MNVPSFLLSRRGASICLACRRSLRRQFSSSPSQAFAASFQSYPLKPHAPPQPRNAAVPDSSIARPVEPPLPKVHETRPPKDVPRIDPNEVSLPEREAQTSRSGFAAVASSSAEPASPAASTPVHSPEPPLSSTSTAAQLSSTAASPPAPKPARPSKLRAPRKAAMRLTPAAVTHLRALLSAPDPKLIRVGVRNRGCSGLAYHLEYVDTAGAFDEAVEQDGVRVLIDSKALFSIIGSEMDWVEDKLSQRFVFRNPNIKEQCGCGESFMV